MGRKWVSHVNPRSVVRALLVGWKTASAPELDPLSETRCLDRLVMLYDAVASSRWRLRPTGCNLNGRFWSKGGTV